MTLTLAQLAQLVNAIKSLAQSEPDPVVREALEDLVESVTHKERDTKLSTAWTNVQNTQRTQAERLRAVRLLHNHLKELLPR